MGKQKALDIVFLNQPSQERVFRSWAEVECSRMGARIESLTMERRERDDARRSA